MCVDVIRNIGKERERGRVYACVRVCKCNVRYEPVLYLRETELEGRGKEERSSLKAVQVTRVA